uniref:PAZ domain-containing protein n=1 Tax=Steinernema glaseri TaxID=37863 RepID=A0A1I7ZXV3_9BILA
MSRRTGGTSTLYESRDSSEQSDVDFAKRPQNGVNGHVIDVTANCCRIEFADKVVGRQLYKYAVEMRINGKQFTSPSILRRIFWKVVDKHRNVFPGYGIVFDDRDSLFSLRSIPVNKLELHFGRDDTSTITLELKNEILFEVGREYGELQVAFLNALLTQAERCSIGSTADSARAGSSSTSVSVQGEPQKIFVVRDNLFFVPGNGVEASYIGRGLEMWYALHSLVSLGERSEAIVNYDKKCGVFLKMKMPILEYYVCFVNGRRRLEPQDYERLRSKSLNARQRSELKDSLKGLSFIATYGAKMHYKFYDLLETGARTTFFEWENREDGTKERISVAHYFQKHWDVQLQLPDFPLIQVAPHTKRIYIPMELLMISDRPQRFRKPLPDDCMAEALKVATITPRERFLTIQRLMEKIQINEKSRFMEKFGVAVDKRMIRTDARVLPLPVLTVMDGQEQFKPDPRASWKLDKVQSNGDQKTVIGVIVDNEIRDSMGAQFVNHFNVLVTACREIGVQFVDEGYFEPCSTFFLKSREDIERKVEDLLGILRREYRDIGYYKILILFVTSERNDLNYGDLKATCELQYRVVLEKTFRKIIDKRSNPRTVGLLPSATARNIALKINVKLGGVTTAALPRQLEQNGTLSLHPRNQRSSSVSTCLTVERKAKCRSLPCPDQLI